MSDPTWWERRDGLSIMSVPACVMSRLLREMTVRETSEGEALGGGKVCFLKTDNVVCFNEITKSTTNL